jgi:hypothetical protein
MTDKDSKIEKTIATAQQVSLFILLVALFLGSIYMFNGSLMLAIPLSIILVVAMYYIVWYMVGAKMGKKRAGFSIGDQMLWIFYVLISVPVTFIVLHAFNVEFNERLNIEKQGLDKVNALRALKNDYEKTYEIFLNKTEANMNYFIPNYLNGNLSESELKQRINVNDPFINGLDASNPTKSVREYIDIERSKFKSADTSLFGDTQTYLDLQENKIRNFSRLSINFVLTDLDEKLKISKDKLDDYLNKNAKGGHIEFNIEPYINPTLIAQPLKLLQQEINPILFLIILLINGLLLLPYLMAPARAYESKKKSTKKPEGSSSHVDEW